MKIFMAAMSLGIGGAETHIVELGKALKLLGHDVAIASNGGVYVDEILQVGIRHYQIPMHRRDLGMMRRSRRLLRQALEQERPDVVHAHARIPAFLCASLQKKLGFPFITTAHGVFAATGVLRYMTNWGQYTLAVSDDIRDYLVREYHLSPHQIGITINGVDTDRFSPQISGAAVRAEFALTDAPTLVHVCRLDVGNDLVAQQLIQIAPELHAAVPGIQMLIVGGGTSFDDLCAKARAANDALGRTCIHMTGPRTDVNALLCAGDLFVGVSRAALEAMSACRPALLAGPQGYGGLFTPEGLRPAIDSNFCFRHVPTSQPQQLRDAVVSALALSPETRAELGAFGRQVVQEHYSIHRMAEDCLQMYRQVRHRKYQVVMSGYYGFSNAGDDAILQSVHQGILAASGEIGVTVLSNDPTDTRSRYGLDALPRFRFWSVVKALLQCDALLSGGGSLLQDRTSTRSLLYYLAVIRGAEILGKPVMLYANGIGPVQRPANRRRVKKAVERATLVTLRDRSSAQELQEMGVRRTDLHVTADPVFNLAPAAPERAQALLDATGLPHDAPFVAVSVRDWPDTEHFPQELAALCDHLHTAHGLHVLFVLMQPSHDLAASQRVRALMTAPSHLLEEPTSPEELMAVLGGAKLCVAMRLHTLIFAARMAVPLIGLDYDPKVDSYLKELEMPSAGRVTDFHREEAIAVADALMADYDACRARLAEKAQALAKAAWENERLLLEMLRTCKG